MPLADYRVKPFSADGVTHDVYHRGTGPCVLIAPEIPGITPNVARFADRLVDRGFSVAIASLFGTPGDRHQRACPRRDRQGVREPRVPRPCHPGLLPATAWLRPQASTDTMAAQASGSSACASPAVSDSQ